MKNSMELRNIMKQAWLFVKMAGMSMSDALKQAWKNFHLRQQMKKRIVKFWYTKVNGECREAYGHLIDSKFPPIKGGERKSNPTIQVYFDTIKNEFRCFKVANLISFA